ncbi:YceH family protein [Sphaerotilus sulfidivorans]|uniref:YceH family protein n=1 Tax=Sphaerotilus sulfidivorans TaxID=639200 RepID=UPI002355A436|nr:YceH family protein [Sphaerotilus sulfidivorans]
MERTVMIRRTLTALEARIVAVLVEKESTVPDTYPLSLNALCAGCSQKTARDPVMSVNEAQALAAIEELKALSLVIEISGTRTAKFEHNMGRALGVPGAAVALLATLMLRGPQTAAELRLHSERLHRFADVSSVEGFLDELAGKAEPMVRKLPRAPGARESRWVHLLCGEVQIEATGAEPGAMAAAADAGLAEEVAVLRAEVAELRARLDRLAAALGTEV